MFTRLTNTIPKFVKCHWANRSLSKLKNQPNLCPSELFLRALHADLPLFNKRIDPIPNKKGNFSRHPKNYLSSEGWILKGKPYRIRKSYLTYIHLKCM